jgi:superfamily I DNA/RNA helicase
MSKSKFKFRPHINILRFLSDLPYGCGKSLLSEVLIGKKTKQVKKLHLDKKILYGSLALYDKKDVVDLINLLIHKEYLSYERPQGKYFKILKLTEKGKKELQEPHEIKEIRNSVDVSYQIEKVTNDDKKLFKKFGDALKGLSNEQKKAVIHKNKNILCIAGAGTGKTTVLTKRIWFLSKFRNADQKKILAITFTRKARKQMMEKLDSMLPGNLINVETFNSFCEKIIRKYSEKIYDKNVEVMGFKDKKDILFKSINDQGFGANQALELYFTNKNIKKNEEVDYFLRFMYDIYSVLDYHRNYNISLKKLKNEIMTYKDKGLSNFLVEIIKKIYYYKEKLGYRDFTDQIIHAIEFFEKNRELISEFSHILVDEYQDVNDLQIKLIELLNPENLFVVGDPRQSIYGWRGSKIEHILEFQKKYQDCSVLQLTKNYRSNKKIVQVINSVIKPMNLPDLNSNKESDENSVVIVNHGNQEDEMRFIVHSILSLKCKRNHIFVLARTNSQLDLIEPLLKKSEIDYVKRTTDYSKKSDLVKENQITLSTVHAIKGLEASVVYIMGANTKYFPCIASDHPVMEIVKFNESYDKFDEELRVFYVAMSRAKSKLIINYHGSKTIFLDPKTSSIINNQIDLEVKEKYKTTKTNNFSDKSFEKYFVY